MDNIYLHVYIHYTHYIILYSTMSRTYFNCIKQTQIVSYENIIFSEFQWRFLYTSTIDTIHMGT